PALLSFERKDRQERYGDDEQAEEQRRADLSCRLDDHFAPGLAGFGTLQPLVRVLDHHDRSVDHRADGDGDATEAHDVRAQPERVHAKIGDQDSERQRDNRHQRAPHMQEEDDADQRDNEAFLHERAFEGGDRAIDQIGTVIAGLDGHPWRQPRRDLREPILDVANDRKRILSETLQNDAGNDLAVAVHLGDAAPLVGGQLYSRYILEQERHAAI